MELTQSDLDFNIQLDDENTNEKQQKSLIDDAQKAKTKNIPQSEQSYSPQRQEMPVEEPSGGIIYDNFNLKKSGHPIYCVLTFVFKVAALLCGFFMDGILGFILVLLFSSFDFWVTKNLTAFLRKLIGLRYWSDFDEQGDVKWIFESPNSSFKSNSIDATFFWTFQITSTFLWGVALFLKIIGFSFFRAILYTGAFLLSLVNLVGFYKCRGEHKKKVGDLTKKGLAMIGQRLFQNAL